MISQLQHLKQCGQQIRKCQSWLAAIPIDFHELIEALDVAHDKIDGRIEKEAAA